MAYAFSDEWHQWFVEGRSCELRDVGIDTMGVILGTCLYNGVSRMKDRGKKDLSKEKNRDRIGEEEGGRTKEKMN